MLEEIIGMIKDKNYTNLEKARLIYIELGKRLSFDPTYQNTDISTMENMYQEKVDYKTFNKKQIICRTWSQLYSQLLDSVGIKNEIIDSGHTWVEFYINDRRWVADATDGTYTDLSKIKHGDLTEKFGPATFNGKKHYNFIMYSEEFIEKLKEIDYKLGYSNEHVQAIKLRDFLIKIKNGNIDIQEETGISYNTEEEKIILKLEYLFSKLGILNDGYYEVKDYVYFLEWHILNTDEYQKVKAVELKRTNKDKSVDIIQCIYTKYEESYVYYLLAPNLPIRRVSESEIVNLALLGYGIDEKIIPGINFPKKFTRGKISSKTLLKYKIYDNNYIYNQEQASKLI